MAISKGCRAVDAGQCNDAYSAIILAVTLAEKLGCGVNDLPLSLVLSWFEQKAIVILLTLLSLGVKNIVTGPTALVSSHRICWRSSMRSLVCVP